MKNVVILGANGRTAKEITFRLLEQNDVNLTLVLRHAERLNILPNNRIKIIEGDATDPDALQKAIRGQNIVISAMGGMDLGDKMKIVVDTMEKMKVARIIAINAGGIYDELPAQFNSWDKMMVGHTRSTNLKAAGVIEKSTLEYTILRPVWLTNNTSEEFQLTKKGQTYLGTETSRASLGRFVADIVKSPSLYINENLGISRPHTDGDRPAAYRM
ncbi:MULTISPECIES: NAD(P)H-binding protein [Providencia]|uniref:NAD(P)H-binding protein n=1 Tax=Providencia TaxID=586 RepID=UPI000837CE5D|nr:NAD(P)H-binding protein [Providencia heimbachae]MBP6122061.1 NAD(P)H-binding protein [Providencia sp.]NIH24156.1 NAD(P)H-binding protein [Providencia heimbachae]QCJ71542.1 NmrA-like family protein [Providencia heimbachae]